MFDEYKNKINSSLEDDLFIALIAGFNHCVDCTGESGEHYAAGTFTTAEHGGTHIDGNKLQKEILYLLESTITQQVLMLSSIFLFDSSFSFCEGWNYGGAFKTKGSHSSLLCDRYFLQTK